MSPANTAICSAAAGLTTCASTARTDSSADVDATASCQPAASAFDDDDIAVPGIDRLHFLDPQSADFVADAANRVAVDLPPLREFGDFGLKLF